jgi:hypothetical protein
MLEAEDFQRLIEFLTENAGRNVHAEIGQRASDIPDYDDIIATLDGPLGEVQAWEHPERGNTVHVVSVGVEYKAGGRFQLEERRFERLIEHAGAVKAMFDDFYIAVAR